jgi:HAAS domain-containing protein
MSMDTRGPKMTHDPLITAYLGDLERALADADPVDREEVLASVREHIEESLGDGEPDPSAVAAVLEHLGPVERIAAEARGGAAGGAAARIEPVEVRPVDEWPANERSQAERPWSSGPVLLGAAVFSLVTLLFLPLLDVPLAIAVVVLGVMGARRHRGAAGQYWAAVTIGALTVVVTVGAVAASLSLATFQSSSTEGPVQVVVSTASPVATGP